MFNISLTPANTTLIVKPQAIAVQKYTLTNKTANSIVLTPSIEFWQPNKFDGSISYTNQNNPDLSFAFENSDIEFDKTFTLNPNEIKEITLYIRPSDTLKNKDSYSTLFFTQINSGSYIVPQIKTKIGGNILISVSETLDVIPKAEIKYLKTNSSLFIDTFFSKPVTFSSRIQNLTPHYFPITGKIVIKKNNSQYKEIPLAPKNVLSLNSRDIDEITLQKPYPIGLYKATIQLDSPIQSTPIATTFLVFPYSITFFILTITAIIFTLKKFKKINF